MSRYLAEEPIDSIDDSLVSDLLRFIENPPSTGLNVVGLLGARGLGKTSYLRTIARSRARDRRASH
jgi:predicted AAA+ superfamily ATPase